MEEFIKKGWAEKHFPWIRKLPEITEKALDKPRIPKERSLQTLCLQKLMQKTTKKGSVEEVYYKLLFLKPLDVLRTLTLLHNKLPTIPPPPPASERRGIDALIDPEAYDISIDDPLVLQYLLDQNLRRNLFDEFRVHVQDHKVSVFSESKILLQAPTEEMFANEWAIIYGKIALDRQIEQIDLNFDEISSRPSAEKQYWLSGIAKHFPMIGANDPRYAPAVRSYEKEEYIFCKMHSLQFYHKYGSVYAQDLINMSNENESTMTRIYYPDN